ncbi:MAG: hypothetical protein ACU84J_12455 [Gammaproteobacteria bacterium]
MSLAIAASFGAVSTTAVAYEEGRMVMAPAKAIDAVIEKIRAAIALIDQGGEGEAVANAIKDAADMSKEINANDVVDRNRQRANSHLKKARTEAKAENLQPAEEHLRKGLKAFEELKGML